MKKFSKNAVLLLLCLLVNSITSIFIYTYLLAFILDVSSNGIVNVAIFYLVLHVSMIILTWIMAPLFKKFNQSLALKIGIILKFLFVLIVVLLRESIVKYVYIIAVCNAVAEVMFWGGANPLQPLVTKNGSLSIYMSVTKIFSTIISLVIPVLMGFAIDNIGIHAISIVMIVLVVMQFTVAMFINEKNEPNNTKLKYKKFISQVKKHYPEAKNIYINQLLYGFCSNISMLILYYTVITFGSNISIGIFSTISSIIAMIVLAIYNIKKPWFNNYFTAIFSSILMIFSISFIVINLNRVSLILFYLFWNVSIVIPEIITGARRLNVVKQKHLKNFNIENVTISETYLDFGRVIGEVMLLAMGLINNRIFDIICLCLITICVVLYFIHTVIIRKKPRDNKSNMKSNSLQNKKAS